MVRTVKVCSRWPCGGKWQESNVWAADWWLVYRVAVSLLGLALLSCLLSGGLRMVEGSEWR